MPSSETHAFQFWRDAGYTTGLIGKNHCFVTEEDLGSAGRSRCDMSHGGLPQGDYAGSVPGMQGMDWVRPVDAINRAHEARSNLRENRQSPTIAYAVSDFPIADYGSSVITAQTEAFLDKVAAGESFGREDERGEARPFALMVSYPDPHEPYEAPRTYVDKIPPEEVILPPKRLGEFDEDGGAAQLDAAPYPPSGMISRRLR